MHTFNAIQFTVAFIAWPCGITALAICVPWAWPVCALMALVYMVPFVIAACLLEEQFRGKR